MVGIRTEAIRKFSGRHSSSHRRALTELRRAASSGGRSYIFPTSLEYAAGAPALVNGPGAIVILHRLAATRHTAHRSDVDWATGPSRPVGIAHRDARPALSDPGMRPRRPSIRRVGEGVGDLAEHFPSIGDHPTCPHRSPAHLSRTTHRFQARDSHAVTRRPATGDAFPHARVTRGTFSGTARAMPRARTVARQRRGRCLADTDLMTRSPLSEASIGVAASPSATSIRAPTSGLSRSSGESRATVRTTLPLPRRIDVGSGSSGPRCKKHKFTPRA